MRAMIRLLLTASVLALAPPSFCHAQQQPGTASARARVPVLVALAPALQGAATPFRLTRIGGNSPRDVILLAPNADAAVLTQAVHALMVVRSRNGDEASASAAFRVRQPPQRRRVLPWAERILRDARNAAPREIPGMGRHRAVRIWLPRSIGRE